MQIARGTRAGRRFEMGLAVVLAATLTVASCSSAKHRSSTPTTAAPTGNTATNGPEYDCYGLGIGEIDGWWGHTGNAFGITAAALANPKGDSGIVVLLNGDADPDGPAHIAQQAIPILRSAS